MSKTCSTLLINGNSITDSEEILQHQRDFYQALYQKDNDVDFHMENCSTVQKLTQQEKDQIGTDFTIENLTEALRLLKNNKTPGSDGLTADFYKIFWAKLRKPLFDAISESEVKGKLFETARKGILSLIPKSGKDSRLLKNLRPITLLNTDYKIIEKAMSLRLEATIDRLTDQKGFIKGRKITANIRKMLDIMKVMEDTETDAVVLNLDFSKAFDCIDFSAITGSMSYFDYPQYLIDWTRILYNEFQVRVQNNGNLSDWINLERGVHQGGCCSTTYFILCAEVVAIALSNNVKI